MDAVGSREEPSGVDVVAVPGNSAHPSLVMHVSSLRAPVAREIPTDWMVVTPMDLLGDPPSQAGSGMHGLDSAGDVVAPTPEIRQVAAPMAEPVLSDGADQQEPPPLEDPVIAAPNPFGPTKAQPSQLDLGMPASLLSDLLGTEDLSRPESRANTF